VLGGISVAPQRHVSPGEEELVGSIAGGAEDGDRLLVAKATGIVLELPVEPIVPGGIGEPFEDGPGQLPLVCGEEVAREVGVGALPVVGDPRAEQAEFRMAVVPGQADPRPLLRAEGVVKLPDEILGDAVGGRLRGRSDAGGEARGEGTTNSRPLEESPPGDCRLEGVKGHGSVGHDPLELRRSRTGHSAAKRDGHGWSAGPADPPDPIIPGFQSGPDFRADRFSGRTGFQAAPDFIDGGQGPTGYNQIRERPP